MQKLLYPLSFFFIILCPTLKANQIDSLFQLAETTTDTLVADDIYSLAKKYFYISIDTSLTLALRSAALSEKLDYTQGRLNSYRGISIYGVRSGNFDISIDYVKKGLDLVEQKNLSAVEKVNFLINKGSTYIYVDDLGNAIEAYLEAYNLATSQNLDKKVGSILNNMGVLYRKMKNYGRAVETYKEGIKLRAQLKDSLGLANTYYNLGATYAKIDSAQLSFNSINNAREIYVLLGRTQDVKECNMSLGSAAFDLENFEESYKLLHPIERDNTLQMDAPANFRLHIFLARLEYRRKDFDEANRLLNDIVAIEKSDYTGVKIPYYKIRSKVSEAKNQYKDALIYKDKYIEYFSSQNNKVTREFREEMEAKFQTTQKDFEIDRLEKEQELTQIKLTAARQRNIALFIGILFLGAFLWILSLLNKKVRKQNSVISKANQDKEILLKEIHHRVKNNLQVISSLLSMQERKVNDEETKDALKSSKTRVQSMSILHQNLYQGDNLRDVKVNDYFKKLLENILDTYNVDKDISFEIDVDYFELDVDSLVPIGLIANELICNALKHAFIDREEGKLLISLKENNDKLVLRIADDGVGFEGNTIPSKKGSLGSRLITSFTKRLDGEIQVDTQNGVDISIVFDKSSL